MGKKMFSQIVKHSKELLAGQRLTAKISCSSDPYVAGQNYVGIIIYNWDGQAHWLWGHGVVKGRRCRSFYVYIKASTGGHGDLLQQLCGSDSGRACCGGFSIRGSETRYNSVTCNETAGTGDFAWAGDGSRAASAGERILIDAAVAVWKTRGPTTIFDIDGAAADIIMVRSAVVY